MVTLLTLAGWRWMGSPGKQPQRLFQRVGEGRLERREVGEEMFLRWWVLRCLLVVVDQTHPGRHLRLFVDEAKAWKAAERGKTGPLLKGNDEVMEEKETRRRGGDSWKGRKLKGKTWSWPSGWGGATE